MQPARTDIFHTIIHLTGHAGNFTDRILFEYKLDPLRGKKGLILYDQGILGLQQDPDKILHGKGIQLNPNGESALKLRQQIGRFAHIKSPRCNKQDMICFHHPVFGGNRGTFDNGKEISLHPFPRDVGSSVGRIRPGHLVQFIQENDPVLLGDANGLFDHIIHIDQLLGFFLKQDLEGFLDLYTPFLFLLRKDVAEHLFHIKFHFLDARTGKDFHHGGIGTGNLKFHIAFIHFPASEHTPKLFPR